MTRLRLLLSAVLLCSILLGAVHGIPRVATAEEPADRTPNIVLMFVDNVGYGDLGCYGNPVTRTPVIDQLAREGVRCTDFYIGSPSCMPSRGALLTGRHPVRTGLNEQIYLVDEHLQRVLPLRERLLPDYLRECGYTTGCFGKWNLGFAPGHRPTERGFDEYLGNISGNCDYVTHVYNGRHDLYWGTEPIQLDGYTTDVFADAACDFIRRNRSRPFFAYIPFNAAHYPNPRNKPAGHPAIWQAPKQSFEAYGYSAETRNERERYRAVLTALDTGVGRVLGQLNDLDLVENTLVILLSDNGSFMLPGRGLECGSNLPFKGGGTLLYEGGIRVPCLFRWPDRLPAGALCDEPLWAMDLLPMIVSAAGGRLPGDRILDGRDPTRALSGQAASPHEALFFHYGSASAMREGGYKLFRRNAASPWELFDLRSDPGETANLAASDPEQLRAMSQSFDRWWDTVTTQQ